MSAALEHDPVVEQFCTVRTSTPLEVAASCRLAGLIFLNSVSVGGGKQQLAMWLLGAYRKASCPLPGVVRTPVLVDASALSRGSVAPDRVEGLVTSVRNKVLQVLEQGPESLTGLHTWARSGGGVIRSQHDDGSVGWIPVDWPRMRLEDRVLSLFTVDCLLRPADYSDELAICRTCAHVSFSAEARARRLCLEHAGVEVMESRMRPRATHQAAELSSPLHGQQLRATVPYQHVG